jgi:hypothetical protein
VPQTGDGSGGVADLPPRVGPARARGEIFLAPALMKVCRAIRRHSRTSQASAAPPVVGGVSPRDVHQQHLSDCYFLSGVASLAAVDPEAIAGLITTLPDGTYTVRLFDEGRPVEVPVDPRALYRGVALHGADRDLPELWPAIVESAFIALRGGPNRVDYGWADEGLTCLTGRPFSRVFLESPRRRPTESERVWQLLLARSRVVPEPGPTWEAGLSSPAAATSQYVRARGLLGLLSNVLRGTSDGFSPRHAYALLGIGENPELGRYVVIYNQRRAPEGASDPSDDGVLRVSIDEFLRQFRWLHLSAAPWA